MQTHPIPKSSLPRMRQVAGAKDQLKWLEAQGYVSSWKHEAKGTNHNFTIATTTGGVYTLTLNQTRLFLAGFLAGAQGREAPCSDDPPTPSQT